MKQGRNTVTMQQIVLAYILPSSSRMVYTILLLLKYVNCSDPQPIADSFNDYFLSHPINIHNNIQSSITNYSSAINSPVNSMYFEPITDNEIKK